MRKKLALTAAVIAMIGTAAAAPATASAVDPSAPSPVVTADPTSPAPEAPRHGAAAVRDKNFVSERYRNSCLDDSSGQGLRMHGCSESSYDKGYQKWKATKSGDFFKFRNVKTGQCLDGSSGRGLRTHTCSSSSYNNGYQKWHTVFYSGTWAAWRNVATGECMDYSSAKGLRLHGCSATSFANGYQAWNY